jgi:hypothetical protein
MGNRDLDPQFGGKKVSNYQKPADLGQIRVRGQVQLINHVTPVKKPFDLSKKAINQCQKRMFLTLIDRTGVWYPKSSLTS